MLFNDIVHIAGWIAVAFFGILILANAIIIAAQLLKKRKFAHDLINRLRPFTNAFRIGNFTTSRVGR